MRFSLLFLVLLTGCTTVAIIPPLPDSVTIRVSKSSIVDTNGTDILLGKAWNGMTIYSNDYSRKIWYQSTPQSHPYAYFDFAKPSYMSRTMTLTVGYKTNLNGKTYYANMDAGTLKVSTKDFPVFFITSVNWLTKQ